MDVFNEDFIYEKFNSLFWENIRQEHRYLRNWSWAIEVCRESFIFNPPMNYPTYIAITGRKFPDKERPRIINGIIISRDYECALTSKFLTDSDTNNAAECSKIINGMSHIFNFFKDSAMHFIKLKLRECAAEDKEDMTRTLTLQTLAYLEKVFFTKRKMARQITFDEWREYAKALDLKTS